MPFEPIDDVGLDLRSSAARVAAVAPTNVIERFLLDDDYGSALCRFVLFREHPDRIRQTFSEETRFYNMFHWYSLFHKLYAAKHGRDLGMEDDLDQLVLKSAPEGTDWNVVQEIADQLELGR